MNESQHFADLTLICFCDTSIKAYAAAVYLYHSSLGTYKTDLIFSKTCLAPEQIRLELLGVLIGVRALKFVEKELHLPVTSKVLWTDSQCVLHWMQTAKPLPAFITNRLKEIKAHQSICFKYVPTEAYLLQNYHPRFGGQVQNGYNRPEWRMPETNLSIQEFDIECEKIASVELKGQLKWKFF